jgi:hypothetical protein
MAERWFFRVFEFLIILAYVWNVKEGRKGGPMNSKGAGQWAKQRKTIA